MTKLTTMKEHRDRGIKFQLNVFSKVTHQKKNRKQVELFELGSDMQVTIRLCSVKM